MISAAVCFPASTGSCYANNSCASATATDTDSDSVHEEMEAQYGLSFDFCATDNDCIGERRCYLQSGVGPCTEDVSCVCAPSTFTPCTKSLDCPVGESCARDMRGPFTCMSTYRVQSFSFHLTTAEAAPKYPLMRPCEKPAIIRNGLIGDRCKGDEFCAAGRHCIGIYYGAFTCCTTGDEDVFECTCYSLASPGCAKESDCMKGEACVMTAVAAPQCYSREAIGKLHQSLRKALVYL